MPSETKQQFDSFVSSLTGSTFRGKFLLGDVLGRGAFGAVLSATAVASQEAVAVKVAPLSDATLAHEVAVYQKLTQCPHVADLIDFDIVGSGHRFLVLSKETMSLSTYHGTHQHIPNGVVSAILIDVLCGLRFIHRAGIVHRDIAPRNLLISKRLGKSRVLIADFGLSSCRDDSGNYSGHGDEMQMKMQFYTSHCVNRLKDCQPLDDLYSVTYVLLFLTRSRLYTRDLYQWREVKEDLFLDAVGTLPREQQVFAAALQTIYECPAKSESMEDCYRSAIECLEQVPGYSPRLQL